MSARTFVASARVLAVGWLDRRQARAAARAKVKYPPPPRTSGAVSTGRYAGDSKVPATFHPGGS